MQKLIEHHVKAANIFLHESIKKIVLKEGILPTLCKACSVHTAIFSEGRQFHRKEQGTPKVLIIKKNGTVHLCGDFKVPLSSSAFL